MSELLRFTTRLTKSDVLRTHLRFCLRPGMVLRSLALWAVFVTVVLVFWIGPQKAFSSPVALLVSGLGGAIGSWAFKLLSDLTLLWVRSGKAPGLLGAHRFELRDDGLFEQTDVDESMFPWASIHAVRSGKDWLEIEVKPAMIHYIPPATFSEPSQFKTLAGEIQRRIALAKAT